MPLGYMVQQEDIDMLSQKNKALFCCIDLLNSSFKKIDELQGELISDSFTIDASSDIRRTCSLSFVVKNKAFVASEEAKIWFDKYIRIWYGVKNNRTQNIHYYPMGVFLFNTANYSYDPVTSVLSLECVDLMGKLTGVRGGQLSALTTKIPVDTNIRTAIIGAVTELGGFSKYRVSEMDERVVPYDIEVSAGNTVFNLLSQLRDLYPGYEMFFDDDIYVCQPTPNLVDSPTLLDHKQLGPLVIAESMSKSFEEIKNCTEVWGRCIDVDYVPTAVSYSGNKYTLTLNAMTLDSQGKIPVSTYIMFKAPENNLADVQVTINKSGTLFTFYLLDEDLKRIKPNSILKDKSYVIKCQGQSGNSTVRNMVLQGQSQIRGIAKLYSVAPTAAEILADKVSENCDNIYYQIVPDNPHGINKIGETRNVLSGGEYEKIYTDNLASERARYENEKTTRASDSIDLELITIPWLDVNQKIEYESFVTGKTETYITRNISGSLTQGTMTVNMTRFYPLYNF